MDTSSCDTKNIQNQVKRVKTAFDKLNLSSFLKMDSWRDDQVEDVDAEGELVDHSFGGKDAILFLIDASPKMHRKNVQNPDDGTAFEMSLKVVHTTLRNKIFGSPNDVVGVMFFGTLEKVGVRDFDNLSVFLPFGISEGRSILKVEEYLMEHPNKFESDFGSSEKFHLHEALWQSQTLFNEVSGKMSTKKILLVNLFLFYCFLSLITF